jgi:hypothetical protein
MVQKNVGANFQITVDGKTRSYRDTRETALEAGIFLKERHPPFDRGAGAFSFLAVSVAMGLRA